MRISDWSSDVCSSDLKEHGVDGLAQVETWQEALGSSSPLPLAGGVGGGPVDKPTTETRPPLAPPASGRGTGVALIVLPLDHGFASDAISLLTEQDILGERARKRVVEGKSVSVRVDLGGGRINKK